MKGMSSAMSAPESPKLEVREITVSRTIPGHCADVYRSWIEPERFAYWFGADLEVPLDKLSLDARPGGKWKATMLNNGEELHFGGTYRELLEPQQIVMAFEDVENGTDAVQLLTVTFTAVTDFTTEVVLHQIGLMPDGMPEGLTNGYNTFMDKLTELMAIHD